jgi:hypothetical protein
MLFALVSVWSIGSAPPEGESLTTRMLVMGFDARLLASMSSAYISQCQKKTNLS